MARETIASVYPGSDATAEQLLTLALQYRKAAETLHSSSPRGHARNWAPFRLCAVHAIELFLSSAIRASGAAPEQIRTLNHSLMSRLEQFDPHRVFLDLKTHERLRLLDERREYLVVRYAAGDLVQCLHPDALLATVRKVEEAARQSMSGRQKSAA